MKIDTRMIKPYLSKILHKYWLFIIAFMIMAFYLDSSGPMNASSGDAVLESTGYIYVVVMGAMILKEKFSKRKLLGTAIIFIGVATSIV